MKPNCHCSSYRFPHRPGGGDCEATISFTWSAGRMVPKVDRLCEECGQPAEEITVDFGVGAYEYWGCRGVHRDVRRVSACCEASLVENGEWSPREVA